MKSRDRVRTNPLLIAVSQITKDEKAGNFTEVNQIANISNKGIVT